MSRKKTVVVLATGGTIAGVGARGDQVTDYTAGAVPIDRLLPTEDELAANIEIRSEQTDNIDSKDMTVDLWLRLSARVNYWLGRPEIDGAVITHGTDTMEETAYWLSLTVANDKPAVLTGAMRPATAVSADGARNLRQAIKTAASGSARGRGCLVTMNDEIFAAQNVAKTHTTAVNAFAAPNGGALGYIVGDEPVFFHASTVPEPRLWFDVTGLTNLPSVKIIYACAGDDDLFIRAAAAAKIPGLVYAGMGNGSVPAAAAGALAQAAANGAVVVRATRVFAGAVHDAAIYDEKFIAADGLSPVKARILLALALTRTNRIDEIRRIFGKSGG